MPSVAFYISGHGFGHASRQIEIINALGARVPAPSILVRSSAPRWLFDRTVRVPFALVPGDVDTGAVQSDSLHLDPRATILRAAEFHRTFDERARREAEWLRGHGVGLVIADAPPLACAAASLADIPSVVVSNFTWDWIYEGYSDHLAEAPGLLAQIREAYGRAASAWRLPMHGGFATVRPIVDTPWVARHAKHSRDEVRQWLGVSATSRVVLASFGGYGVASADYDGLDCLDRYTLVLTDRESGRAQSRAGIVVVSEQSIYQRGLRYEDLVGAAEIVVSKPGYGIISECVANGAALLYTSRGAFREYDVLVSEMPRFLRCGFIDHAALFGGRWADALDQVLSAPAPPERPATNGAEVIASMVDAGN